MYEETNYIILNININYSYERFLNFAWGNIMILRKQLELGPDYTSWTGPVSRAASVCREPGCPSFHVISKLIFIVFNKRAGKQTPTWLM